MAMKREPKDRWKAVGISGGRQHREDYAAADGRVDPNECEHTQFLDMQVPGMIFPSIGRCLDCGHAIYLSTRDLFTDAANALLTDAQLLSQRSAHRAIWFSTLELPQGAAPGQ